MVNFDQLNKQNHNITELTNILTVLLGQRSLCDSPVTCELFFRYVEAVQGHLKSTDKDLYRALLSANNQDSRKVANLFMSGDRGINQMFDSYLKKWCKRRSKELVVRDFDEFEAETTEMFSMVLERIQDETERLYPSVRKALAGMQAA
jgi:hypothetical protein